MKIKKQLIKREIAGDTILVPVGKTVYDSNGLFVLNEMGAFIWEILPEIECEEQIVERVLSVYDVPGEQAKADVAEFMTKLKQMKIV